MHACVRGRRLVCGGLLVLGNQYGASTKIRDAARSAQPAICLDVKATGLRYLTSRMNQIGPQLTVRKDKPERERPTLHLFGWYPNKPLTIACAMVPGVGSGRLTTFIWSGKKATHGNRAADGLRFYCSNELFAFNVYAPSAEPCGT